MDPDSPRDQFVQLAIEVVHLPAAQHPGPDSRIGCVHGHVEWRKPLLDNPVESFSERFVSVM